MDKKSEVLIVIAVDESDEKIKVTFDNGEKAEFDKEYYYSLHKPYTQI